jgi:hypothetical protein
MDPFVEDKATIDERTMIVERRNGPMFYVPINPTVNSTAKDYKRSFNRSTGIIVFIVTRSLKIADHDSC